jgi:hypothetical protein
VTNRKRGSGLILKGFSLKPKKLKIVLDIVA